MQGRSYFPHKTIFICQLYVHENRVYRVKCVQPCVNHTLQKF